MEYKQQDIERNQRENLRIRASSDFTSWHQAPQHKNINSK